MDICWLPAFRVAFTPYKYAKGSKTRAEHIYNFVVRVCVCVYQIAITQRSNRNTWRQKQE